MVSFKLLRQGRFISPATERNKDYIDNGFKQACFQYMCFPVNFARFFKILFMYEVCKLLHFELVRIDLDWSAANLFDFLHH